MSIKCSDIVKHMEELAPVKYAMDWDNVGLLVGDSTKEVSKVIIALDATSQVIDEAILQKADIIITHHPILFKSIKKITDDSIKCKDIMKLIKNDICVYSAHTNLDIVPGGTNDVMINLFDVENITVLKPVDNNMYKKVAVYVPKEHVKNVREAMCLAGAGELGNYKDCVFMTKGVGTFTPENGANPFLGQVDVLEQVKEIKLETIVDGGKVNQVIKAMIQAHPYEEVAYDIFPLEIRENKYGFGRVAILKDSLKLNNLTEILKDKLRLKNIKVSGDLDKEIKKIAVCTGSGMEFVKEAFVQNADVYITSDIKYHEASDAMNMGMALIDATHCASENIVVPKLCEYIQTLDDKLEVIESSVNCEPFSIV